MKYAFNNKTKCNGSVENMIKHLGPFQWSVESGGKKYVEEREVLNGFNIV